MTTKVGRHVSPITSTVVFDAERDLLAIAEFFWTSLF